MCKAKGVAQDPTQAAEWFLKAANQGLVQSQCYQKLSFRDEQGEKQALAQAIQWVCQASLDGGVQADATLGQAEANDQWEMQKTDTSHLIQTREHRNKVSKIQEPKALAIKTQEHNAKGCKTQPAKNPTNKHSDVKGCKPQDVKTLAAKPQEGNPKLCKGKECKTQDVIASSAKAQETHSKPCKAKG